MRNHGEVVECLHPRIADCAYGFGLRNSVPSWFQRGGVLDPEWYNFAVTQAQLVFRIELDREADGRWLAEIPQLPGVMAYGRTEEEAVSLLQALALRVIADRIEHGEFPGSALGLRFVRAA